MTPEVKNRNFNSMAFSFHSKNNIEISLAGAAENITCRCAGAFAKVNL